MRTRTNLVVAVSLSSLAACGAAPVDRQLETADPLDVSDEVRSGNGNVGTDPDAEPDEPDSAPAGGMDLLILDGGAAFSVIPSEDYTIGLAGNTAVVWPLHGTTSGILQISTIGWDFPSEIHKWELVLASVPGSFAPEDPDCARSGATNHSNDLFRLTVVPETAAAYYDDAGTCIVGAGAELYANIRPLETASKSCDDVLCRFKFFDTVSSF